jgi:DNA-binding NtrC family response regulator
VQLDDEAKNMLINYRWPGNVRELKNIAEQTSVLTTDKMVTGQELKRFLPERENNRLPMLLGTPNTGANEFANEREILYKLFFDMKKDVNELKKMFFEIIQNPSIASQHSSMVNEFKDFQPQEMATNNVIQQPQGSSVLLRNDGIDHHEEVEESLNIMDKEKELIEKALKKHRGKRKDASSDLGISERTLYRKLKEYDIKE